MKKELSKLYDDVNNAISLLIKKISEETKNKPLILFEFDKVDTDEGISIDEMYDMPYAYYVDKWGYYCEGRIARIEGDDVVMIFTSESDYGEEYYLNLNEVPIESLVAVLDYIE